MGGSHHRHRLRRDWHQAPGRVCMMLCVRMLCWLGNVHVWDHHCWRGTTHTHRVWGCRHHGKYRHAHVLDGVGRSGSNGSGRRQLLMGQLQKVGRHCRAAHLHGRRAGHGRYSWLFLLLQGRWGRHPVQNGLYGRRVGILSFLKARETIPSVTRNQHNTAHITEHRIICAQSCALFASRRLDARTFRPMPVRFDRRDLFRPLRSLFSTVSVMTVRWSSSIIDFFRFLDSRALMRFCSRRSLRLLFCWML